MPNPAPPILDYAAPRPDDGKPDIFTDGRTDLYVRLPAAELPRRCVICNGRVGTPPITLQLNYVDPEIRRSYRGGIMFYWIYILIMIVRGIHERFARRSVSLTFSVCPAHRSRRGTILFLRLSLLLVCIVMLPTAEILQLGDGVVFLCCIAVVLNLIFRWPKRQLRIDRMTATHAVIIGPSEEFLQSLRRPRQL